MLNPTLDKKEQLASVRNLRGQTWIEYERARRILEKLADLYSTPKYHRMPNLLIVGDTNNGKTKIVERFAKKHKPEMHLTGKPSRVPILLIQAPPTSDESRLYNAILNKLCAPFRPSARVDQRQLQVLRVLDLLGVRMLIIDEIHNILAGPAAKQRQFLNVIKYLGNELMIPIVAVGTRDALNAIHSDPQLANRFEPAPLPIWQMGEEYLRLLASFQTLLPIQCKDKLTDQSVSMKILALSEGTIGEIADLLMRAVRYLIESHKDRMELALDACGYCPPSARRRPAGL